MRWWYMYQENDIWENILCSTFNKLNSWNCSEFHTSFGPTLSNVTDLSNYSPKEVTHTSFYVLEVFYETSFRFLPIMHYLILSWSILDIINFLIQNIIYSIMCTLNLCTLSCAWVKGSKKMVLIIILFQ